MQSLSRYYIIFLSFFLCSFCSVFTAKGQGDSYVVKYDDSLITSETSSVLYNKVQITNTGKEPILLNADISIPAGWKNMFPNRTEVSIAPGTTEKVLINLICAKNSVSAWQQVNIRLWTIDSTNVKTYSYLVKTKAKPAFIAQNLNDALHYEDRPKEITLEAYLKNTGNVTDQYTLHINNKYLALNDKLDVTLAPGRDTTISYPVSVSKAEWRELLTEEIFINISGSGNRAALAYELSRPQDQLKENKSAYQSIPLTLEGGVFAFGPQLFYYGGARSDMRFGDHSLILQYRSRQLSNQSDNYMQRDMFLVDYRYKRFQLRAGNFSSSYNYITIGNSLSLGYHGKHSSLVVSGTKSYKNSLLMQGDNINAVGEYKIGKMKARHLAEANFDRTTNLNGYIYENGLQILKKTDGNNILELSAKAGVSAEEKTAFVPVGINKTENGYMVGYNFNYDNSKYSLTSFVDHYSSNYAGFRKGMSVQQHTAKRKLKDGKSYVGATYMYSVMKRNYFRDSIYNSDVLSYNNARYGLMYGRTGTKNTFSITAGILKQAGQSYTNALNEYYFTEIGESYRFSRKSMVSIMSISGYSTRPQGGQHFWITSNSMNLTHSFLGLNAMYLRNVVVNDNNPSYYETVNAGPFVTFSMFNRKLVGNVRYNIARAIQDEEIRHGVGANLSYNNSNSGTRVIFNGYYPFKTITKYRLPFSEMKYGFLSVQQDIHIPIKQKYYDLKVVIYDDENNNNLKDDGEHYLKDVPVDIGQNTLYSNADGEVTYENIPTGNYAVSVFKTYTNEGLIPSHGPEQNVAIEKKSSTLNLPFKKGRVISGNVKVVQDALNATQMTGEYIKINATDSLGRKYTTLSDFNGDFFLYVPDGIFTVALEHESFGGNVKAVKSSYIVNIAENENAFVAFELRQKKRQVRFLEQPVAKSEEKTEVIKDEAGKAGSPKLKTSQVSATPEPKTTKPVTEVKPVRQNGHGHGNNSVSMR